MNDLIYAIGTIAFFALMIAYVRGCDRLGHAASEGRSGASAEQADQ